MARSPNSAALPPAGLGLDAGEDGATLEKPGAGRQSPQDQKKTKII